MAYRVLLINEAKLTINSRTLRSLYIKVPGLGLASPLRILKLFEYYNKLKIFLASTLIRSFYYVVRIILKRDWNILRKIIKR